MGQSKADALPEIIDRFYASAIDGEPWDAEGIRSYLGTDLANILLIDHDGVVFEAVSSGLGEGDRQHYLRNWGHRDELTGAMLDYPAPACVDTDLMPRARMEASPIFEGFYEPRDIIHQGAAKASAGNGLRVAISAQNGWHQGPLDRDTVRHTERLTRHLRRAVAVRQTLAAAEARLAATEELLAQWRVGLLLCDEQGFVRELQGGAEALLRRFQASLRLPRGRLRLVDRGADRRLQALLRDPSAGAAYAGPSLAVAGAGAVLEITVLPKPCGGLQGESPDERIVMLRDARGPATVDLHYLRRRLGLTRAESEVLGHLMLGRDVDGVAEARGCTVETIRSYLKSLRAKLACHTQAQLVALGWRAIAFCPTRPPG